MSDIKIGDGAFKNSRVIIAGDNVSGPINMGDVNNITNNHLDLRVLLPQLEELKIKLGKSAIPPQEQAPVLDAILAAKAGDTPSVYKHLRKAGGMVLTIAREIGVNIIANIICGQTPL